MPLNVPNLITLSRIILIPLLIGIYYLPDGRSSPVPSREQLEEALK